MNQTSVLTLFCVACVGQNLTLSRRYGAFCEKEKTTMTILRLCLDAAKWAL